MPNRSHSVIWKVTTALALAAALILAACSSSHHRNITLTFIRHAQSESNAEGVVNTDIPGPGLTEQGKGQAQQIAHQLRGGHYDGVYASNMIRTQQTAAPLAQELGRQVQILPGLREVDAGWYDDASMSRSESTYLLAPMGWVRGDRTLAIPGSINGNEFNDQFGAAVQKIYNTGDANPVAFSHSTSIMAWTLMNVKNPRNSLMTEHPLPNIGRVVITGNPITGWRLIDWDGIRTFN